VGTVRREDAGPVDAISDLSRPARVLILSASMGEGHNSAARALAADLAIEDPEAIVEIVDGLSALGWGLGRMIRKGYERQLRRTPGIYGFIYTLLRSLRPLRMAMRLLIADLGGHRLSKVITAFRPTAVVSTYPGLTIILGHMRRTGRLSVPAYATITDLGGLEFWVDRGIDEHFVMHSACEATAERLGGRGSVRLVRPLVVPAFYEPREPREARRTLGLPSDGPLVVVSGGGWGIGALEEAARVALRLPESTVVVLGGHSLAVRAQLQAAFAAESRVVVLGFTEQMSDLLAAADVLVHSTGGVTVLEALARGCPVVSYGHLTGHLQRTARAMATLGVVSPANNPVELESILRRVVAAGREEAPAVPVGPSAASFVLARPRRVNPLPVWRIRGSHAVGVLIAALLVGGWTFSADAPYPLVAKAFHLHSLGEVSGSGADVGLVIRAPEATIPELTAVLAQHGSRASFALRGAPSSVTVRALDATHNEPFPELGAGRLIGWIHTRRALTQEAAVLGLRGRVYYLAPSGGLTLGQYLLARRTGAVPVRGEFTVRDDAALAMRSVHGGQILVVTLDRGGVEASRLLIELLGQLDRDGLSVEPVRDLIGEVVRGGAKPPVAGI
jgi:processive 1,2-diacylglycerol beta-glucosyltransferase